MRISSANITFYIPVRNAARTLNAAIASVRRQTARPADFFLLVDMRSTDESVKLARASGVRIVEQVSGRLGHARNLAIEACQTRWLASCDADVELEPEWLERLIARAGHGVAVIGGCTNERLYTAGDRWRAVNMPHNWGAAPLDNPFMLVSEMLADTVAIRDIGGYRADLQSWEDSDCCQRLRHAGYTLRYEPGAVAWHDRRDSVEAVLDLRWFYSSYRQKARLESIPGLREKLATNRTYSLQSISQTLHSEHADVCAVGAALWFHHARRDLAAAFDLWPLIDSESRRAALEALDAALKRAADRECPALWPLLAQLLPSSAASTADPTSEGHFVPFAGKFAADSAAKPRLSGTRGFCSYVATAGDQTTALLRELGPELRAAVESSAERLIAYERGEANLPEFKFATPAVLERERTALEAAPSRAAWRGADLEPVLESAGAPALSTMRVLEWGNVAPGEQIRGGADRDESAPWLVLLPHLERSVAPRATLLAALAAAQWAVVAYQPPSIFVPGVPIVSARDLASWGAAAGFELCEFQTEAGLTRLILRRAVIRRVPIGRVESAPAVVEVH